MSSHEDETLKKTLGDALSTARELIGEALTPLPKEERKKEASNAEASLKSAIEFVSKNKTRIHKADDLEELLKTALSLVKAAQKPNTNAHRQLKMALSRVDVAIQRGGTTDS